MGFKFLRKLTNFYSLSMLKFVCITLLVAINGFRIRSAPIKETIILFLLLFNNTIVHDVDFCQPKNINLRYLNHKYKPLNQRNLHKQIILLSTQHVKHQGRCMRRYINDLTLLHLVSEYSTKRWNSKETKIRTVVATENDTESKRWVANKQKQSIAKIEPALTRYLLPH